MDPTNPTARTSSPSSSGGFLPPILDANTIQAAYLAIQMQNQLQQNQQQAAVIPPLTQLPHNVTSDPERLLAQAALAQAQMSPVVSALQDSTASSQCPLPPRQTSAFAPIRTIGNPITAVAPSCPQLTPPSTNLDVMLLQMQMAAAAAGLAQAPLNLLQSSSALNLLTPHLRLQAQGTGIDSLPLANHAVLNQLVPDANIASQQNLIAQACGLSNAGDVNETPVRPSNSLPDSYQENAPSPGPLPGCLPMDRRSSVPHKRHHSDMSVLRSLCEDTDTPEPSPAVKRRSLQVNNERRMFASEAVMSNGSKLDERRSVENIRGFDALRESLKEEGESPQQRSAVAPTTSVLPQPKVPTTDPNSPNRHHPLNHQPPAMEARFLECIAAIALHSNFALPDAQRGKRDDTNDTQTVDNNEMSNKDESAPEAGSDTQSKTVVIEEGQTDENRSESRDGCKSVEVLEDTYEVTGLDTQKTKKTWPLSAIDDELCKEMESYKGTDVPMIHAYVIPPRSDTSSSSSDASDEHNNSMPFQSVPSLAVPVPILNILLERILDTMLQT